MRRLRYDDAMIEEAVSHAETQDEEILKARKKYQELYDKFDADNKQPNMKRWCTPAACISSARNATNHAG